MSDVTITVTGPGGVISHEMILIRRALEAVGIEVIVKDDYPVKADQEDQFLNHRKELLDPESDRRKTIDKLGGTYTPGSVTLVAKHQPWGG